MLMVQIGLAAALAGTVVAMLLLVWVLVDLARLRRNAAFADNLSGSLRLHRMVLGGDTTSLDEAARARINAARTRLLSAFACFAGAMTVLFISGP
ncbi:MAG: hypothetical protein KDA49_18005 [Rhodospirillaceae bacterium]|nr:hypothetical protein [Rhodospirillaceae bacterium]